MSSQLHWPKGTMPLYNGSDDEGEIGPDLEQEWSQTICKEILSKVKRERMEWMSEDTWTLVEERRELKSKMKAAMTRNQKLAATRVYNRRDKRKRIDDIAQGAEEAAEQRDMNKVYATTRMFSGKRNVQSTPVKNKNGVVLRKIEDQLNRWKENFQEILNRPAPENPPDLTEGLTLTIRTGQITMVEVKRALKTCPAVCSHGEWKRSRSMCYEDCLKLWNKFMHETAIEICMIM